MKRGVLLGYQLITGLSDTTTGLRAQPGPTVYEKNGTAHGVSTASFRLPQSPDRYFATLKPGQGVWVTSADSAETSIYVRRGGDVLYAFPVQTPPERVRQAGSVAIWAIALVLLAMTIQSLPVIASVLRRFPRGLDFRTRTSIYLTAVVILPLIVFVIFEIREMVPARSGISVGTAKAESTEIDIASSCPVRS